MDFKAFVEFECHSFRIISFDAVALVARTFLDASIRPDASARGHTLSLACTEHEEGDIRCFVLH